MKQAYLLFTLMLLFAGTAIAEAHVSPKPGKHKSHKKTKKKKSKYLYNFQH